jgi:hypothetical protein
MSSPEGGFCGGPAASAWSPAFARAGYWRPMRHCIRRCCGRAPPSARAAASRSGCWPCWHRRGRTRRRSPPACRPADRGGGRAAQNPGSPPSARQLCPCGNWRSCDSPAPGPAAATSARRCAAPRAPAGATSAPGGDSRTGRASRDRPDHKAADRRRRRSRRRGTQARSGRANRHKYRSPEPDCRGRRNSPDTAVESLPARGSGPTYKCGSSSCAESYTDPHRA